MVFKNKQKVYIWVDNLLSTFYFTSIHWQVPPNSGVLLLSNRWKPNSACSKFSGIWVFWGVFPNKRTSFHSSKKKSPTYLNFQWIDLHIRSAVHGTINFILNNIQQCVVFIFVRPLQSHHHLAESTWAIISQLIMKIKHTCNKPSWLMHTQQLVYTWAINDTDMKTLTLNNLTRKR